MSSTIVLITGANSGVGFATSKVLASASQSFHVIMASRSLAKVQTALSEIESSDGIHGTLSALQLDVTDKDSIAQAAKTIESQHGHLDVLINNAAIGNIDPDIATCLSLNFATNVVGPAVVSQAFRPLLLKSQNPYSIYVSSGGGSLTLAVASKRKFMDFEEGYRVSKVALNMLAVLEARDYGPKGLKVFTMCPGFVVSNLRGETQEQRNPMGNAGDPMVSGQTLLSIIEGKRDEDVGKFVHKDGVYAW